MKTIGDYSKNGFYYELLQREGDVALYKVRLSKGRGCLAYEVIIVQRGKERIFKGHTFPAGEYAPGNEAFGRLGWTYPSLEAARAAFQERVLKEGPCSASVQAA